MADRLGLPAAAVYARRRSSELDLNPVIAHRQGLAAVEVKARLAPAVPRDHDLRRLL